GRPLLLRRRNCAPQRPCTLPLPADEGGRSASCDQARGGRAGPARSARQRALPALAGGRGVCGARRPSRAEDRCRAAGDVKSDGKARYVVGIDFGTESGRALVVDCADGRELATAVYPYANGVIDERLPEPYERVGLESEWALQDPDDYVRTFEHAVPAALA